MIKRFQYVWDENIDFHALGIFPSNPKVVCVWASSGAKGLFVSSDSGKTWTQPKMTGLTDAPFDLVVDPEKGDRTIVYGYRFDKLNSGIYLTAVFE